VFARRHREDRCNRPRHISLTIDAVLAAAALGTHLRRASATVIGHSLGACTALAASLIRRVSHVSVPCD